MHYNGSYLENLVAYCLNQFQIENKIYFWKPPLNNILSSNGITLMSNQIRCDVVCIYQGKPYFFELKEVSEISKIKPSALWKQQVIFLEKMQLVGAICYFIIRDCKNAKIYFYQVKNNEKVNWKDPSYIEDNDEWIDIKKLLTTR